MFFLQSKVCMCVSLFWQMCPTGEVKGFDEDDDASEKKFARTLIMEHNRKKKKSGGFQSMGNNIRHSYTDLWAFAQTSMNPIFLATQVYMHGG